VYEYVYEYERERFSPILPPYSYTCVSPVPFHPMVAAFGWEQRLRNIQDTNSLYSRSATAEQLNCSIKDESSGGIACEARPSLRYGHTGRE
jgi:hypothetical protein